MTCSSQRSERRPADLRILALVPNRLEDEGEDFRDGKTMMHEALRAESLDGGCSKLQWRFEPPSKVF